MKKQIGILVFLVTVVCLLVSSPLRADTVSITLTGVSGGVQGNIYTSPYYATVDGVTSIAIVCDDFFHDVSIGQTWSANVSTISDLSNARFFQGSSGQTMYYQQAAWLVEQLFEHPDDRGDISYAIWSVFNPSVSTTSGWTTGPNSAASWLSSAQNQTFTPGQFTNFQILTPTTSGPNSPQEMIVLAVPTPEPSAFLLLGTALIGLAWVVLRNQDWQLRQVSIT